MYILSEEEYKLFDIDERVFQFYEIPKTSQEMYLRMYSTYMKLLTEYLISQTEIKKYDNLFLQHQDIFPIVEDKDPYQLLSNDLLKYFYIRNNLYLYRLEKEEFQLLSKITEKNDCNFTDEIKQFIEKTFKKVIYEELDKQTTAFINFGPLDSKYFAPNNAFVLGVRYQDSTDYNTVLEQLEKTPEILRQAQKSISESLSYNVKIIQYDQYSIEKTNSEEKIIN